MPPRKKRTEEPAAELAPVTPEPVNPVAQASDRKQVVTLEEVDESAADEPKEILTAQRINNFVVFEFKKQAFAFDMVSDPYSVITYQKNVRGQWVKTHGPYHATVKQAMLKIREKFIRSKGAGKLLAEMDELIKSLDLELARQLVADYDRLRLAYKTLSKAKGLDPLAEAEAQLETEEPISEMVSLDEPTLPRVSRAPGRRKKADEVALTSEELFEQKKAAHKPPGRKKKAG